MAQGKQGIWLLTFPDRTNTGNLVNFFFTQGKLWQHRENFENLEFFENFVIKVSNKVMELFSVNMVVCSYSQKLNF